MTMSTDEKLTETLERLAARATTPTDGQSRVERRLRSRRNRRRTTLGVAATVSALGISIAFATLAGDADLRNETVASIGEDSTGSAGTDAETPPVDENNGMPRLSLSVPGLSLTLAHVGATEFTAAQIAAPLGFTHFQSFRAAPGDWSLPSVYIYTVAAGAPFGIGEDSPNDGTTTTVDVNGSTGYLGVLGAQRTLGWRLADGTAAYVLAPDLAPDELIAIGRSMSLRPDGRGWDVRHLPDGLVSVLDEENSRLSSIENHSLTFQGDAGEVELHSYTTTPVDMETRIADYSIGAQVTNTTVNGHPAAVTRSPHDVRVLWYDPDNQVANYMIINGAITDDIELIVSNIDELSQDQWKELLATADTTYWTGDESSPTSTP